MTDRDHHEDEPDGDSIRTANGESERLHRDEPFADEGSSDDDGDDSHVDPDVPSDKQTGSESGKVLSPEELDITDSEYVEELDESGRYVVSPGGRPPNVTRAGAEPGTDPGDDEAVDTPDSTARKGRTAGSPESARTLLAEELARSNGRYGIDIVARFDGQPVRHRTVSSDVVGTFENLIRWYARHVTDDTPVDEVIEILLSEADFGIQSEPSLAELLDAHGLDESDSVADLVDAIRAESGRSE